MRQGSELRYLHWNHLCSTVMETSAAGSILTDQKYYPFGAQRDAGPVATDHRFTGQKKDETGLYYYNARYYDPEIGHFISPDAIVPGPLRVDAYNRYMYALGNPLKFNDPSGHCALNGNGNPDENNDADCWGLAYTIANMWDSTDYWQKRYGDISVWNEHIAPSSVDLSFMENELNMFFNSDAGRDWLTRVPRDNPPPLDTGDYWRISFSYNFIEFTLTRDDFHNWYFGSAVGLYTPSISLERGDILANITGAPNPSYLDLVDIDSIGLQSAEKSKKMKDALAGDSAGGGAVSPYFIGFAGSESEDGRYATQGAILGIPGVSYGPQSRSWLIWEAK